jgi:hypothetical protein
MFEQTLEIKEADIILFGKDDYWQIERISTGEIIRKQSVFLFWSFTLVESRFVVLSEIEAECVDFNGVTFDAVMIDPPHHITESNNCWEFNCIVMGKQILKIK